MKFYPFQAEIGIKEIWLMLKPIFFKKFSTYVFISLNLDSEYITPLFSNLLKQTINFFIPTVNASKADLTAEPSFDMLI